MNESKNARLSAADRYEIAAEEHDLAMAIGPEPVFLEEDRFSDIASREDRDERDIANFDALGF